MLYFETIDSICPTRTHRRTGTANLSGSGADPPPGARPAFRPRFLTVGKSVGAHQLRFGSRNAVKFSLTNMIIRPYVGVLEHPMPVACSSLMTPREDSDPAAIL
jgi:hypothetical protein